MNKKVLGIIIGVFVLLIAIGTIVFVRKNANSPEKYEERLSQELKTLGKEFFEQFYYKQIAKDDKERKEMLEKFSELGIKISLDSLARWKYNETDKILKKFVSQEKVPCDKNETKVIIYPKSPYKSDSYTIDADIVCSKDKDKKITTTENKKTKEKK